METSITGELSPIELLPIDIIEIIAQDLTVEDLASCCACSHGMRKLFDDDILWKPYCSSNEDLEKHLKTTACVVEPGFVSPEDEGSTLSPISRRRMAFMRENHLWNNWRQGKYRKEDIKKQSFLESKCCPISVKFLTNDIITLVFKNMIKLLDRRYPHDEVVEPIYLSCKFSNNYDIHTENDMIVIMHNSTVQVYYVDFVTRRCSLEHAFFFEDSHKLRFNSPEDLKRQLDLKDAEPSFRGVHVVAGTFFVGVLSETTTMHIWDLKKGKKLKQEECPVKHGIIGNVKPSETMNLVLNVKEYHESSPKYLVYSLTKLAYLSCLEIPYNTTQFYVHNDFVLIGRHQGFTVYNYLTSKLLTVEPDCPAVRFKPYLQMSPSRVLFIQSRIIKKFNLVSEVPQSWSLGRNLDRKPKKFSPHIGALPLFNLWITGLRVFCGRFIQFEVNNEFQLFEVKGNFVSGRNITSTLQFKACSFNKSNTSYIFKTNEVWSVVHLW